MTVVGEGMVRLVVGEKGVDKGETLGLDVMVRHEKLSWVERHL